MSCIPPYPWDCQWRGCTQITVVCTLSDFEMVLVFDVAHRIPYVISDGDGDVFPAGCFALIGFASDDLAITPERGGRDAITAHPRLVKDYP